MLVFQLALISRTSWSDQSLWLLGAWLRWLLTGCSECSRRRELQQSTPSVSALLPFLVVGTSRLSTMYSSMDCQRKFRTQLPSQSSAFLDKGDVDWQAIEVMSSQAWKGLEPRRLHFCGSPLTKDHPSNIQSSRNHAGRSHLPPPEEKQRMRDSNLCLHCGEPVYYAVRYPAKRPSLPVEEGLLVSITALQPLRVSWTLAASCCLRPHWLIATSWQPSLMLSPTSPYSAADPHVGKDTEWDATDPYYPHWFSNQEETHFTYSWLSWCFHCPRTPLVGKA